MKQLRIALTAATALSISLTAGAQTIDFETGNGYKNLDVYDTWESSPFRDGRLKGNVMVVDNPDKNDNTSNKVLGAQRSRYGSNTFGVRVDLAEPFELTKETKFVHVLLHRPVEGRVMLVGLGHFRDFKDQGDYVEQFWELSSSDVAPGKWGDAVFAVKGSGDIDINALVLVPECESPHNMSDDFLFYIDDIEVNNSGKPRIVNEDYPIWAGEKNSATIYHQHRRITNSVGLANSTTGEQKAGTGQNDDRLLYHLITDKRFQAKAGDKVRPTVETSGKDLNCAVFLDIDNDGNFDDKDLMSRSATVKNGDNETLQLAPFIIPAGMKPGVYRLRYVVDTEEAHAGGSATTNGNTATNGGSITDIMLNIHGDQVTVNDHQLNGEVLAADGRKLNSLKAPYGKDFRIKMNPEAGFTHKGLTLTSGYLEGDSIIHGNPQFIRVVIPAFEGNEYTIPGELMDANVLINGHMTEIGKKD